MSDHITIYNHLSAHPDIQILPADDIERKFLVSLAEDTVDKDGYPTRQVNALGLERRRRASFYPDTLRLERFDISFKDAKKTSMRREWEEKAHCLSSGENAISEKVAADIPGIRNIAPDSYRVSSVCIAARASYDIIHHMDDENAAIQYKICNDACVFSSPHADRVYGYRREVELEAEKILGRNHAGFTPEEGHRLLDKSIAAIDQYLSHAPYNGLIQASSISKVCHANNLVALDYGRNNPQTGLSGVDYALLQNVRASEFLFESRRFALGSLIPAIPPAKLLKPGAGTINFADYFPDAHKFPAFPNPKFIC